VVPADLTLVMPALAGIQPVSGLDPGVRRG